MAHSLSLPILLAVFAVALAFARPFGAPRGPRGPWSA
jgi:hypothetical protein